MEVTNLQMVCRKCSTQTSHLAGLLGDLETKISGDIEFDQVFFKFESMKKPLLKDISFKIPAGSYVGICGERGAGKSTMFKLMLRLYDPDKGTIKIGNKPLDYYNPLWIRSQVLRSPCS